MAESKCPQPKVVIVPALVMKYYKLYDHSIFYGRQIKKVLCASANAWLYDMISA